MNLLVVLIGTGGHLLPLIALIPELRSNGFDVYTVSRLVGVEKRLVENPNLTIKLLPFSGKSLVIKIKSLITICYAAIKIGIFMKQKKIKGIISSGGYGSVPAILAAIYHRVPYFMIELNRIPGRVVRIFSSRAEAVFSAIPMKTRIKGKVVISGLPLRDGFVDLKKDGEFILIMGGSQGARFLNILSSYLSAKLNKKIFLISGDRDYRWVKKNVARAEIVPFTNEPWQYIARAELVIARAGGLSSYELAANRIPMILIPFPYSTDRHQHANGEYYAEKNGAIIIEQGEPEVVAKRIVEIVENKEYLRLGMANPPVDGKKNIVEEVMKVCLVR